MTESSAPVFIRYGSSFNCPGPVKKGPIPHAYTLMVTHKKGQISHAYHPMGTLINGQIPHSDHPVGTLKKGPIPHAYPLLMMLKKIHITYDTLKWTNP